MNELKRHKISDFIKWVFVFLFFIGLIGAVIGLSIKLDRQTTINSLGGESYSVGAINDNGEYEESNSSIFTPKGVTVDGLTVAPVKGAEILYRLFFYDEDDVFVSATETLQVAFDSKVPETATVVRIMITPTADEDGKVTLLEVFEYAKLLKVSFNK